MIHTHDQLEHDVRALREAFARLHSASALPALPARFIEDICTCDLDSLEAAQLITPAQCGRWLTIYHPGPALDEP